MAKKQVCVLLDEKEVARLEKLRSETGVPMSELITLELKGYSIIRNNAKPTDSNA